MKIALIGYGKMGKLIEELAEDHEIVAIIDSEEKLKTLTLGNLNGADVCIDFSSPKNFIENIKTLISLKQTVVAGTTGWYDKMPLVKELVLQNKIGFLYAPNFSIGINIFLKIVNDAASLIDQFDNYDASGFEIHHNQKQDSPSGTAKSVAETLLEKFTNKKSITYDLVDRQIDPSELHYASIRVGANPGQHNVIFDSLDDTITLTHQARNRAGFARGAIKAAEWLQNKKGFYTIHDFLEDNLNARN